MSSLKAISQKWKIWLNSKYIKIKQNQKLEAKFFSPFQVLHLVSKQTYKLELPKQWKINNVFHISLLKQNNRLKGPVDKEMSRLEFDNGKGNGDNKKYKVKAI